MIKKCFKATIVFLCYCLCMSSSVFALDTIVMSPVSVEGTGGYTEIYIDDVLCPVDALPDGLVSENGYLKSNKTLKDSKIAVHYYPETENTTYEVFVYQPSTQSTNTDKMVIEVQHADGVETVDYNLQQGTEGYFSLGIFQFSTDAAEKITITKVAGTSAIKQYAYWGDVKLVQKKIKEKTGVVILDDVNANNDPEESGRVEFSGSHTPKALATAYGGYYTSAPNREAITANYYPRLEAGTYSVYTYKRWFKWGSIKWDINNGELSGNLNTDMRDIALNGGWFHLGDATFTGEYGVDIVSFYRNAGVEGEGCVDALMFVPKINVKSMRFSYNGLSEDNPVVLPPAADVLEMEFNYVLSDLTEKNVNLKGPDGNVQVECVQDGSNVVRLIPLHTLLPDAKYTMTIHIFDVVTKQEMPISYTFETNDSVESVGGKVVVDHAGYEKRLLEITGTVYGSMDRTMGGRVVTLSLISPSGERYDNIAHAESDKNGAFHIEHTIADYEEDGAYQAEICVQYTEEKKTFEFSYITRETENMFLEELKQTENVDDVNKVFTSYGSLLNLDSYSNLSDQDAFSKHFVSSNFENIDAFNKQYQKMLLFETLNQTNTDKVVTDILSSREHCEVLGLNYGILELLPTRKNEFVSAVRSIEQKESLDAFLEEYREVQNTYLLKENAVDTIGHSLQSLELNKGQAAELKFEFEKEQENIKGISVTIRADEEIFEDIHVVSKNENLKSEVKVDGKEAEVTVIYEKAQKNVIRPFEICFTPDGEVPFDVQISVSGTVMYEIADNNAFSMTAPLDKKEITVSVENKAGGSGSDDEEHNAPNHVGGSTSGGGGGSSSGSGKKPSSGGSSGSGSGAISGGNAEPVKPSETDKPTENEKNIFTDISDVPWAEESIYALLESGIVRGVDENTFEPNRNITRAEFSKMLVLAMDIYDETQESTFTDSDKNAWYDPYIACAQKYSIINGKDDGSFGVHDYITREDMAVMLMRAFASKEIDFDMSEKTYSDDASIHNYAYDAVYKLSTAGILNGMGDNAFMPQGNLSRAQAAKVIHLLSVEYNK